MRVIRKETVNHWLAFLHLPALQRQILGSGKITACGGTERFAFIRSIRVIRVTAVSDVPARGTTAVHERGAGPWQFCKE